MTSRTTLDEVHLLLPLIIEIGNEEEYVKFSIDPKNKVMTFDRTHSGIVDFEDSFAAGVQTMPYDPQDRQVDLSIWVDESSVEIFLDDGRYVFTNQVFPESNYNSIVIKAPKPYITYLSPQTTQIKSIWNNE